MNLLDSFSIHDIQVATPAPIAAEALMRIATLYAIEDDIRGRSAEARKQARQQRSKPLVEALHVWLQERLAAAREAP